MRKPQFSEQLSERFPENRREPTRKISFAPAFSERFFQELAVVPARQTKNNTPCQTVAAKRFPGIVWLEFPGKFRHLKILRVGKKKAHKLNFLWPKMARLGPRF